MLSTDNLNRPEPELHALLQIIEDVAVDLSRPGRRWQVRAMGAPEVLPPETVAVLKQAEEDTCDRPGATVNLAVGYGGRQEIADAVRSLLAEHAERGHVAGGPGPGARGRAHRRAPLHARSARPRPGHPHQRRAAAVGLPALADGEHRVPLHRRRTGPTSAGSTSSARCATTPPGTAASAADGLPVPAPPGAAAKLPGMSALPLDLPLEYVRLGLRFDRLEPGFVDAFTGDPRLRAQVADEPAPTPSGLRDQARALLRRARLRRRCRPTAPTTCAAS